MIVSGSKNCGQQAVVFGSVRSRFFFRQNIFLHQPFQTVPECNSQKVRAVFQRGGVQNVGTLSNDYQT